MSYLAQFESLIRAVAAQVCAGCPRSICAEDVEQAGRLALLRRFRAVPAEERNDSVRYVRAVLRNAMWDAVRGGEFGEACRARDAVAIGDIELAAAAPVYDPFLGEAVRRLRQQHRRVIELRYIDDLDQHEVATRLGISRHAVRRAEASGIAALRRQLRAA